MENDKSEDFISDVIHSLIDLDPAILKRIESVLYIITGKFNIMPKCTDLMVIDERWKIDLDRFCERKLIAGKSQLTVKKYKYELTRCLSFINKDIADITDNDLNNYIESYKKIRNVKNSTLEHTRRCICSFFNWMYGKGYINNNPVLGLDAIKMPKVIKRSFSDTELEKIKMATSCVRDRSIVEFLYSTGVRISEMCALNRKDVSFDNDGIIIYGKGDKEREVYLSDIGKMYLKEYLNQRTDTNEALFVSEIKPHSRISDQGVRFMLSKLSKQSGIDKVHPHRFRTTCATNLLRKGMSVEEVAEILGHDCLDTTMCYALISKDKVKSDYRKCMSG